MMANLAVAQQKQVESERIQRQKKKIEEQQDKDR